jgi:hypothetical protein
MDIAERFYQRGCLGPIPDRRRQPKNAIGLKRLTGAIEKHLTKSGAITALQTLIIGANIYEVAEDGSLQPFRSDTVTDTEEDEVITTRVTKKGRYVVP